MMHVLPVIDRTINDHSVIDVPSLSLTLLFLGGATGLLTIVRMYMCVCVCVCVSALGHLILNISQGWCVCDNSMIVTVGAMKAKGSDGRSRSKPAPPAVLKAS